MGLLAAVPHTLGKDVAVWVWEGLVGGVSEVESPPKDVPVANASCSVSPAA